MWISRDRHSELLQAEYEATKWAHAEERLRAQRDAEQKAADERAKWDAEQPIAVGTHVKSDSGLGVVQVIVEFPYDTDAVQPPAGVFYVHISTFNHPSTGGAASRKPKYGYILSGIPESVAPHNKIFTSVTPVTVRKK